MEVILGLMFGATALGYVVWGLVSPFVVLSLKNRIADLEQRLRLRERDLLELQIREAQAARVAAAPPASHTVEPATSQTVEPDAAPKQMVPPTVLPPVTPTYRDNRLRTLLRDHPAVVEHLTQTPREEVSPAVQLTGEPMAGPASEPPLPSASEPFTNRSAGNVSSVDVAERFPTTREIPNAGNAAVSSGPPPAVVVDDEPSTLEEILAGKWLTWVGALAVIIGTGFGFKYAIENNWVGPTERVVIGILSGLICFAGGTFAITRKYVYLAQGLTGAALGILYLSLHAAFGWYGILSYEAAFLGMILTTASGLSFAGYFNVQPTAVLGMLGGFLTPAMLWPQHDPMWTLFPYLLMLDLGVLLIAGVRRWAGLEILAFGGTLWIWLSWHHHFYKVESLEATAGWMTSFLVLFSLLSVWHNVIRKRTAMAGDFFLILATPTVYFTALYALTFNLLPDWQGEFALGMMLFYAALAGLAGVWHPAGRSVIAALAGLAATFLILAAPLELTGHWVTICWIAQAVLLVELGLYFREKALLWTGLGLLAKVQVILLIYFLGTLADPIHFQTAFVRIQLHLIGRPELPLDAAESWRSLINGRSLSYLADVIGFAVLAWELSRRRREQQLHELLPQSDACLLWLNVTVPVMALSMIVIETFVWGVIWRWDAATIVSAWTIWTALLACALIFWSQLFLTRGIEALGWILFVLVALFVGYDTLEAFAVCNLGTLIPPHRLHAYWMLNPRGISFLAVVGAAGLVSLIYTAFPRRDLDMEGNTETVTAARLGRLFGTAAFGCGLGLCLLETYVWGVHHQWSSSKLLAANAIWTTAFLIGATAWRAWFRAVWVNGVATATFALLELFILLNAATALGILRLGVNLPIDLVGERWLLNPRAIGALIATFGVASAAYVYRRMAARSVVSSTADGELSRTFGSAAYTTGLGLALLETWVWGQSQGWQSATVLSGLAAWSTLFMVGAVAWRIALRSAWVDQLVVATFVLLEALLVFNTLGTATQVTQTRGATPLLTGDWWLFNPRGVGFLLAILGCSLAAGSYSRDRSLNSPQQRTWGMAHTLGVAAYLTGLALVILETCVWGTPHGWLIGTLLSSGTVWISLFGVGLVAWRSYYRTADFDGLILLIYGSLALVVCWLAVGTLDSLALISRGAPTQFQLPVEYWFWNPRFLGFLVSVLASAISAGLYHQCDRIDGQSPDQSRDTDPKLQFDQLFAIAAYITGVIMFTLEVYAQGTSRDWRTTTSLGITLVWTIYATLTLIAGIYWRSGWLRVFSLGLFVLTVVKVFLFDIWLLETAIRVFAFISLGIALLLVSFLYRRYRDRIRSWMAPHLDERGESYGE